MTLSKFMNPFATHDVSDFPGVHVPLANARRDLFTAPDKEDEKPEDSPSDDASSQASQQAGVLTLESLKAEIDAEVAMSGHDTAYDRKSQVINKAITDIGMGRYQWELFVLCGFGWLADNLWLQGVALTLPQISAEFGIGGDQVRYTTLALFTGLCIGASFWGIMSDVVGRRLAFNGTL